MKNQIMPKIIPKKMKNEVLLIMTTKDVRPGLLSSEMTANHSTAPPTGHFLLLLRHSLGPFWCHLNLQQR